MVLAQKVDAVQFICITRLQSGLDWKSPDIMTTRMGTDSIIGGKIFVPLRSDRILGMLESDVIAVVNLRG